MQRLADELVGDMGAVEIAGVDMIDAALDRFAQHRQRFTAVLGRTEHARTRKLHGAIAHAVDDAIRQLELACFADVGHVGLPNSVAVITATWGG